MFKQPADVNNKNTQIIINDTCAGISLFPKDADGPINYEGLVSDGTVRVELIRKSQPNAVLYEMPFSALYEIWAGLGKTPKGLVVPFALKENLILSKDAYIQIDITWKTSQIVGFNIQKNTLATSTNVPISFKKVLVDGELEVDTEYFEYLVIPETITKIETFVNGYTNKLQPTTANSPQIVGRSLSANAQATLDILNKNTMSPKVDTGACGCDGTVTKQKIEMDWNFMSFNTPMPTETNVLFKTEPNQKIKFFGEGTLILMQA